MQLIVLYILWRFTKAILVGWSKALIVTAD